ncbi:MAG: hypothetical protein QME81_17000 [bacterium]|nr:hypothetical protein [bacterium]
MNDMSIYRVSSHSGDGWKIRISPDDTRVCYQRKGRIYISSLEKVAGWRRQAAKGYAPHWWVDPENGDEQGKGSRGRGRFKQGKGGKGTVYATTSIAITNKQNIPFLLTSEPGDSLSPLIPKLQFGARLPFLGIKVNQITFCFSNPACRSSRCTVR